MIIDDKLLAKLEKLGNIRIDDSKKDEIKSQLSEILGFVENLEKIDLSKITSTTAIGATPLREDTPRGESTIPKDVLAHSPKSELQSNGGYFIVPKIIE